MSLLRSVWSTLKGKRLSGKTILGKEDCELITASDNSSFNIESRNATFQAGSSYEQQMEAILIATGVAECNPPAMRLARGVVGKTGTFDAITMWRALEWLDVGCWTVEMLKSVGYPG